MPKKYRLSRADLTHLPRPTRRVHGNYFALALSPLPTGPRVVCVVPKKIAARAVDRNTIERRCREAVRPLMAGIHTPVALVFHAKREAREASSSEIARDIEKLLRSLLPQDTIPQS